MERITLPYRIKTELFLLTPEGGILAQDRGAYLMFPGGGVDEGEDILGSAERELLEETEYKVDGDLTRLVTVDWDWFPEWANTPQRQLRYREFRGERVHLLVGRCLPAVAAANTGDDRWHGGIAMTVDACLEMFERYWAVDHRNTYAYRVAQRAAIVAVGMARAGSATHLHLAA